MAGILGAREWSGQLERLVLPPESHEPTLKIAKSFLGDLPCWDPEKGFTYFDPTTDFLSYCFTSLLGAVVSLALVLPSLVHIASLVRHEKGPATACGLITRIFAIAVPVLRLTDIYLGGNIPTLAEWTTIGVGAVMALFHYVQDGRVLVSSSPLLVYWLLMSFVASSELINEILEHSPTTWVAGIIALMSLLNLYLETHNPARGNHKGSPIEFDRTSVFERINLSFADEVLKKGSNKDDRVTREDLPKLPSHLSSLNVYDKLATALGKWKTNSRLAYYRVILSVLTIVKFEIFSLLLLDCATEFAVYAQPTILSLFLNSLLNYQNGTGALFPCFYFAVLVGAFPMVGVSLQSLVNLMASYTYVVSRTSLISIVYRKALKLSPKAREEFDSAKIMNLINVDTDQVDGIAQMLPNLVSAPLALVLSTWQLYRFIGTAMFAAVFIYAVFIPYSGWVSKKLGSLYPKLMKFKDERNKATSNAFRNIKSLKLYAWEKPYHDRIAGIRDRGEIDLLRKRQTIQSGLSASWTVVSDIVALAIFSTYLYFHMGTLSPGVVFPTMLLLQYVSMPFMTLPFTVTFIVRAITSQNRINELLTQKDQDSTNYFRLSAATGFHENTVLAENATVSWNGDLSEDKIALRDISFTASNGDLICVTGRVGAGKSAFLRAIAGELVITGGSIVAKGSLAYCSQESWLQNATIKDNILFGKRFDEEFYKKTLEACDLVSDIEQMPQKDDTDVGERGISLSGGQKARVSLARAVYSRSNVYLLDDVLSAVDEHVSATLIDKLFSHKGLLSSKTIILATNNVKVLSHASQIVALQDKSVVEKASFKEVVSKKEESVTYRLIKEFGKAEDLERELHEIEDRKAAISRTASSTDLHSIPEATIDPDETAKAVAKKSGDDEEKGASGEVNLSIFKRYFDVVPSWFRVVALIIIAVSVVTTNSISIWLGVVSNHNFNDLSSAKIYFIIYLVIAMVSAVLIFASSSWSCIVVAVRVSRELHNRMLWNVMHAPMTWFDVTPLGRLINRFTGDMSTLDDVLPNMLYFVVRSLMNFVMGIVTVITGAPIVIVIIVPLLYVGNIYRRLYVPSSRQISRMTSAANSPILSHIEESLKGASTVRAFDRSSQFIELYDHRTNYWMELAFLKQNLQRWLTFRIQAMTSTVQLASALFLTFMVSQNRISVGYCAVVLHFGSRVGVMAQQTLSMLAQLEVSGVSLERILEYVDIKQEAPAHVESSEPPSDWPQSGSIAFDAFSTRYKAEGPDVLKNLSLTIQPSEKIGIVGRTGSGKSTLTLSIFRIIEASKGNIDIDRVNTSDIGLYDLRSRLSIIPQDAQIFEGTLRENLDPLKTADDARLWEVLDQCSLKDHFTNLGTGLDTLLVDGGDNLSRGQAQLVCLGRALIHEARILVLDEATASVDVETDRIVQKTIRTAFKDRTIVTIAHRLNTIMDSDRILVLDKGEVKEFDTPERLLEQKGYFYSLVNADNEPEIEK